MSLLHRRIGTIAILALFLASSVLAVVPTTGTWDSDNLAHDTVQLNKVAESANTLSIPYVDKHYGAADGIIDPTEYAFNITDDTTGITAFMEHNATTLYVGLEAPTSGWIALGWQNYTGSFIEAGLNNSDLIYGYAPGTPHEPSLWRAVGTDLVTVHYILTLRNGTVLQESDYPDDTSEEQLQSLSALTMYRDAIFGMRIGEMRHFVIPADQAYTDPTHHLYGEDLEYEITLTRITRSGETRRTNPADESAITFSDEYGVSTLQHMVDSDQSRILSANASDDGAVTQLEYIVAMESMDSEDISLLNETGLFYPFFFMYGNTEDTSEIPIQRTYWSDPPMVNLVPNSGPTLIIESPSSTDPLSWIAEIKVNATDNTYVRSVQYQIDDAEAWIDLAFNSETDLWEARLDLSDYSNGLHTIWLNATDPSNMTSIVNTEFTIERPYIPLLGMRVDVTRKIMTETYLRTNIKDQFTITNNGSASISALEIYLPSEWAANFLSLSSSDVLGVDLKVVRLEDQSGMMRWRVYFANAIGHENSYIFTTTMSMHSLATQVDYENKGYELTFLKFPVVPYVIREASLEIAYRTGDSLAPDTEDPATTAYNLAPSTIEKFILEYRSFTPEIVSFRNTVVRADPWGWLSYQDTIRINNIGYNPESQITFTVPAYTTNIKIYDRVGVLTSSQLTVEGEWNASRALTINLVEDRFGPDQFKPGFSYEFIVDYVIQISEYEEPAVGGSLLDIPFGSLDGILIRKHTVDIVLPYSVNTIEAYGSYRLLHGVFDTTLRYTVYNTTNYNPPEIQILYQVSFLATARPLVFSIIIALMALAYVSYRGVYVGLDEGITDEDEMSPEEKRQVGAPAELLSEFANLYSKKTALNMDLEKLEAARRRGKVKKREFMIRERDIKAQLEEIDVKLPDMKNELSNYGARYRDMVAQLELQNEKIEGAKAGLRQLLLRKKKQRISRVAFEKSRQDYLKTIQKATSAIDRTLLSIQEEAGDL
ncbi:MAG: FKBP-type peptidyl-prolyl cis-trans isomerase [Candidatus Thorarchaeota archaeon]